MDLEILFLQVQLPGRPLSLAGLIIHDTAARLEIRTSHNWHSMADPEDAEVLAGYRDLLESSSRELGAQAALASWQDTFSNVVRLSEPMRVFAPVSDLGVWADALASLLLP